MPIWEKLSDGKLYELDTIIVEDGTPPMPYELERIWEKGSDGKLYEIFSAANVVTVTLPGSRFFDTGSEAGWQFPNNTRINLGTSLAAPGTSAMFLQRFTIIRTGGDAGFVNIWLALSQTASGGTAGPEFSDQMEGSGAIILTASNGTSITIAGISDSTEPYRWRPSNGAALVTFINTVRGLSNKAVTLTFNDDP